MNQPHTIIPNVGLVGVSGYAQSYLRLAMALHDEGRLLLCAVVIINPDEQAEAMADLRQRGIAIYADYRVMLSEHRGTMDLCLIPTGIPWHARMTVAALEAGANVLVEKPLAGSLADVRAIRQAEMASGRFVAVGYQNLYTPEVMRLKADLCGGLIGSLTSIRFLGIWPRTIKYYSRNDWAGHLHANGIAVFDSPLNNAFGHYVNLGLFLAGSSMTSSTRASLQSAELFRAHAIESFDTAVIRATLDGSISLWIGISHAGAQSQEPMLVIEGTQGRIVWHHENECLVQVTDRPEERIPVQDNDTARRSMFWRVLDRLNDPDAFICSTGLAEATTALVEDVHLGAGIHSFPPQFIEQQPDSPSELAVPVVRGLDQVLSECFKNQTGLFESNLQAVSEIRRARSNQP